MSSRPDVDPLTAHLRAWALHLADRRWPVFPVRPGGKQPAIREWERRATTDPDRITQAWDKVPFNVGIACGPAGLVVVDLDLDTGPAPDVDPGPGTAGSTSGTGAGSVELAALAAARGVELPDTFTVATPSGGAHLYFRCPPGVRLANTARTLAGHVDTRARGGLVVGPGSVRPEGAYDLTDDTDPAELPGWLVQALSERPVTAASGRVERPATDQAGYVAAAVRGETDRVRDAPSGQHNAVLSRAAYALGQLAGAGALDVEHARAALADAAGALITGRCGCTPTENARVIGAGLTAGARNPRRLAATKRTAAGRGAAA